MMRLCYFSSMLNNIELFIDKCRKAKELQELRDSEEKWQIGDCFAIENCILRYNPFSKVVDENSVFLPRIDQTVSWISDIKKYQSRNVLLKHVLEFGRKIGNAEGKMEELFVEFYMFIIHQKIWSGIEWKKETLPLEKL